MNTSMHRRTGRSALVLAVSLLGTAGLPEFGGVLGVAPAEAATIYVSPAGNDVNDGLTWATAKRTLLFGLYTAQVGDQVWVAAGTYAENITLKVGVRLYGGFAGTETDLTQRDWKANLTILDGSQAGSVVFVREGATEATRIDGFTIRNGTGTLSGPNRNGGGIYCYNTSPTIANCHITSNSAPAMGGGIYCAGGNPSIVNNTITGNSASSGGGIYCISSSATIRNNAITGNSAGGGGGISCSDGSPMIAANTIRENSADNGGGMSCGGYLSRPTIVNNEIIGNSAGVNGGGISTFNDAIVAIVNNTVMGNSAGGRGGGIYWDSRQSGTIANTIVVFNSSGLYKGSGTPSLRHNCVYGNAAYDYSGVSDPTGANGNISTDPSLAWPFYTDAHIQPDSPCVDAGDDSVVQAGQTDIDGQPRTQGAHVDIGADESDGTAWPSGPHVIVRVACEGNDANDGSSWALAKRTVQAGIDAVAAAGGGEVWVKGGTYPERITLRANAHVYGGFAGTEMERSARDWSAHVTVLDGGQAGTVVTANQVPCGLSTLDGFTVRNGKASQGGGVYCSYSSPVLANNTITGNTAGNSISSSGGGIYCASSSPTITNTTIASNTARGGGGIYCYQSSPTIMNSTIANNTATYGGGGIYCRSSSPTIQKNTICRNTTAEAGGGGIYCSDSLLHIIGNVITGNNAGSGGGIGYESSCSGTIGNNTFSGNIAFSGGGISSGSSAVRIANNTITGNNAVDGGGIYCSSDSSPTIANTIIAFNSSGIFKSSYGTPQLRNNCFYGNIAYNYSGLTDPTGTNGNIFADPKLAHPFYVDVHIQPDSPCVDAGDDSVVQAAWLDMDGQPRTQGARVDIGADESDGTVWPSGAARVVRVAPGGDDANDGSSWVLAKRTVQAAVNAAAPSAGQVWVAAGTYVENIALALEVAVYGGFAGSETDLSQRDWTVNRTILDGNQVGPVVSAASGLSLGTRIDGFLIRNGKVGVYCSHASPTIANNTISANRANEGAGILCDHASPTIAGNTITGNTASSSGGGIYGDSWSSPVIRGNTICANKTQSGAGIWCGSATTTISSNTITQNSASSAGGGIYCASSATIANNTITGNSASTGGGIYCSYASPAIINNTIAGNSSGGGGGIYCFASSPTIANTIVAFNSSGLCWVGSSTSILSNNCVYGNIAYNYSGSTDATGTNGNISADPKLAYPLYVDVHIQPGSPCVDAGDDSVVQAGWLDMDGQPRTQGAHVDIGADESDGTTWPSGPRLVVRVRPQGDDTSDGSTWALAKRTVQAAITAAAPSAGQVWVATGTYVENITLPLEVAVYGGFSGGEATLSQRNWTANRTVLDGNEAGSVVTPCPGVNQTTRLDGFTVRRGKASNGGGIYCSSASPTIANNTITGNMTSSGGYGGGVDCDSGSFATVANCTVSGNTSSYGGGIYFSSSSPTIVNSTISGNSAYRGGGIYCGSSAATIANNTITANTASSSGGGGGMYCSGSSLVVANTVMAFNSSGIYRSGGTPSLRYNCVYGNTAYNYSGVTDPTGTNGNISADPRFVRQASPGPDGTWGTADDDYGDLRLLPGSPCIDAGNNADVPPDAADLDGDGDVAEPLPFDLAGGKRFLDVPASPDTGAGTPPIVDMGAYEAHRPGDVDGDGDVDVFDIIRVVNAFGCVPGYPNWNAAADFDGNGIVDVFDVIAAVTNFGAGT